MRLDEIINEITKKEFKRRLAGSAVYSAEPEGGPGFDINTWMVVRVKDRDIVKGEMSRNAARKLSIRLTLEQGYTIDELKDMFEFEFLTLDQSWKRKLKRMSL